MNSENTHSQLDQRMAVSSRLLAPRDCYVLDSESFWLLFAESLVRSHALIFTSGYLGGANKNKTYYI